MTEIILWVVCYALISIYFFVGYKLVVVNRDAIKEEDPDIIIPPSTNLGIILFWAVDLIYLNFKN